MLCDIAAPTVCSLGLHIAVVAVDYGYLFWCICIV